MRTSSRCCTASAARLCCAQQQLPSNYQADNQDVTSVRTTRRVLYQADNQAGSSGDNPAGTIVYYQLKADNPAGNPAVRFVVWCHVTCRLFSCLFLASVLVACPRCVHRWSARSSSRVAFSASAVCVVLTLGSCSVLLANSMLRQSWEGNLHSITVSSAHCLFRLAGCPLHSA